MAKQKNLQTQVEEILKEAERKGVKTSFFFVTTFKRYQVQIAIMTELEKALKTEGAMVEKEYVKGRKNLYTNPAISEYNKTATAANNTVKTLMDILKQMGEEAPEEKSKLSLLMESLSND